MPADSTSRRAGRRCPGRVRGRRGGPGTARATSPTTTTRCRSLWLTRTPPPSRPRRSTGGYGVTPKLRFAFDVLLLILGAFFFLPPHGLYLMMCGWVLLGLEVWCRFRVLCLCRIVRRWCMSGRGNAGAAKGRVMLVTTTRGGKRRFASAFPVSALVSVRFPVSPNCAPFDGSRVFSYTLCFSKSWQCYFSTFCFHLLIMCCSIYLGPKPEQKRGWCQEGHPAVHNFST